jgi:hypothetical protein
VHLFIVWRYNNGISLSLSVTDCKGTAHPYNNGISTPLSVTDCKGTAHSPRLRRVAECRENKMSVSNLAKILGPTLVGYSSSEPATMVAEVSAEFSSLLDGSVCSGSVTFLRQDPDPWIRKLAQGSRSSVPDP